jgi:hypothetical protein
VLAQLIEHLAGFKDSCRSQLRYALAQVVGGTDASPQNKSLAGVMRQADNLLWDGLESSVRNLYLAVSTASDPSTLKSIPGSTKTEWITHTLEVFDHIVEPYRESPRIRARIYANHEHLRSALWNKL